MVRFSLEHWNDTSIDKYDNNCTQFASVAMAHAGMEENSDWTDDSIWKLGRRLGEGVLSLFREVGNAALSEGTLCAGVIGAVGTAGVRSMPGWRRRP